MRALCIARRIQKKKRNLKFTSPIERYSSMEAFASLSFVRSLSFYHPSYLAVCVRRSSCVFVRQLFHIDGRSSAPDGLPKTGKHPNSAYSHTACAWMVNSRMVTLNAPQICACAQPIERGRSAWAGEIGQPVRNMPFVRICRAGTHTHTLYFLASG